LSSCVMPVDTVRAPRAWRLCSAWDADTVGSLSTVVSALQSLCWRGAVAHATRGSAVMLAGLPCYVVTGNRVSVGWSGATVS
jgi:hypothetical protein